MRLTVFTYFLFCCLALTAQSKPAHEPFALVELFTSQGCSNCFSAQEKIEKVFADSAFSADSVLLISFHVDYWNDSIWKDPFSKAAYTSRQQEYQLQFGGETVYTPMFVVNGKSGFSGNNDIRLRREIKSIRETALTETTGLKIESVQIEGDKLIFSYTCRPELRNMSIQAALITKSDTTKVNSGENKGLVLISNNTVRAFIKLPLRGDGSRAFLKIPKDAESAQLNLVFWVQSVKDGGIMDIQVFPFQEF